MKQEWEIDVDEPDAPNVWKPIRRVFYDPAELVKSVATLMDLQPRSNIRIRNVRRDET